MTTNTHRLCLSKDCTIRSTYGIYLTDLYCKKHSLGNMINYSEISDIEEFKEDKPCAVYKCNKIAEYNFEGFSPLMCESHAIPDISLYKKGDKLRKSPRDCSYKKCNSIGKDKQAVIGFKKINPQNEEDKKIAGIICVKCYESLKNTNIINSMIKQIPDKIHSCCPEKNCENVRMFGTESSGVPAICETHYLESNQVIFDVNNKGKTCKEPDCKVRGAFNYDGLKPEFCKKHIQPGMINTDAKRCEIEDCKTQPTFGYEDDVAVRCKKHKEMDMIDVKSLLCEIDDCNTQAAYGFDTKIRCGKHKTSEMKIVYKTQICNEIECNKIGHFGFSGEKPSRCYSHKLDDMINLTSNVCSEEGCIVLASYGYLDKKTKERCTAHRLENMVFLGLVMCSECNNVNMNPKYKPYCYQCFARLNPDSERVIEYKTKENAFTSPLKEKFNNAILDKKIEGSNENFRPDFLLKLETHSIIVEIDERQHVKKDYNEYLEKIRLESFKSSLGDKLLIVIRLNPDNYRINNKKDLIYGCFKYNKDTLRLERKEDEFQKRLQCLLKTVENYVCYDNAKESVNEDVGYKEIFLFYNE